MNAAEYVTMREVEDRHWWYLALRKRVADAVSRYGAEGPLLDCGCGTGGTLAYLKRDGIGLDASGDALRYCRKRGQRKLVEADAGHLPFSCNTFGCVLLLDVIYHRAVPEKLALLKEVNRVLQPGGVVVLNAPAYQWLYSSHDAAIHTDRRFTVRQIKRLLRRAEYRVVQAGYWNTLLFPAAAAVRLMRKTGHRESSDLDSYRNGRVSGMVSGILQLEGSVSKVVSMPFGLSVFAVARKL